MKRKRQGVIGIDPGLGGAIAVVAGKMVKVVDVPVVEKPYGKGNMISPHLLSAIIDDLCKEFIISSSIIEAVAAMAGQGVTSVFSFGRSTGCLEGVLGAKGLSIDYVAPQRWKKHFGLLKKEKDMARGMVISMYPKQADLFKHKKDVDRAEAVLIAKYHITMGSQ
jgi:crossover junction endodeoxyribonuclease RuvC